MDSIEKILNLEKESSSSSEKVKEKLEELRKEIIDGESTGDPIRDFAIVTYGRISKKYEEPYRKLKSMLNDKKGKQVLVVGENIESWYDGGCFGGFNYTDVDSFLKLGVLTSDIKFELGNGELDYTYGMWTDYTNLRGPRIIVPVEKHVKRNDDLGWELVKENIEIPAFEIRNWDMGGQKTYSLSGRRCPHQPTSHTTRLLVNVEDDIEEYFRSPRYPSKYDFSYIEGLDLLGIGEQVPEDFRNAYNEEIYNSKIKIIENLKELTKLDREHGGDGARNREIVRNLENAIEMGMSNEEWILAGENPGETLDVPDFISGLCKNKNYEVKIN